MLLLHKIVKQYFMKHSEVIIIGAGPVGLYMAYSLSLYGITTIILEKNSTLNNHPKSRSMNVRTMEILKNIEGFEELMKKALPLISRKFTWVDSLLEKEFHSIILDDRELISLSPIQASFIAQNYIEEHLYKLLKKDSKCTIIFEHELISFSKKNNVVNVHALDKKSNTIKKFCSKFVLGADGAHSITRKILGIKLIDLHPSKSKCCNIYARVDLSELYPNLSSGYFFSNRKLIGRSILSVDGKYEWLFGIHYNDERTKEDFNDEFCKKEIQLMTNNKAMDIEIISKNFWRSRADIAETFNAENVFLVGDSAHSMPPTGGLGLNTGLQDAHNLSWKLAFVIKKYAPEKILQSYNQERYNVVKNNIEFSIKNANRLFAINKNLFDGNKKAAKLLLHQNNIHLNHPSIDLNFKYKSELIMKHEKDNEIYLESNNEQKAGFTYKAAVGGRAPHLYVEFQNKKLSIIDLYRKHFVLLIGQNVQFSKSQWLFLKGLPNILKIYLIGKDIKCNTAKFYKEYYITSEGFVLIRPDGHICYTAFLNNSKVQNDLKNYLDKVSL